MKKTLLISIGILILCIVIAVWTYLFIYGTPKNSAEVFTRFGVGGETVVPTTNEGATVDVKSETNSGSVQKLKQLTTRPVAGAGFTSSGIRYVEQGTGHIYEINLSTGSETIISGTTITQAFEAVFDGSAEYIAITSRTNDGARTVVGKLSQASSTFESGIALPNNATEVAFGNSTGTLFYVLKDTDGLSGYSYTVDTKSGTPLFAIPLRDVRVLWGNPVYVYTTPTREQEGYVYTVIKNDLGYVATGGYGLTGISYPGGAVLTSLKNSKAESTFYKKNGTSFTSTIPLMREKCVFNSNTESLYCATPGSLTDGVFPDDWYKGVISYSDVLWSVDTTDGSAKLLSDLLSQSGRQIDIAHIGTDTEGKNIYFINKNDNTLWIFDTTL